MQLEPLILERNAAALRVPVFNNVSDERLLALFELALRCTSQPTAKRPSMLEVTRELEAALAEITGASHAVGERVDEIMVATQSRLKKSLADELAVIASS